MGTKRFLVTEEEKKNILSLYSYKGILQEQKKSVISESVYDKVKNLIDLCKDKPGTPNKDDNYLRTLAKTIWDDGIQGMGTNVDVIKTQIYKTKNKANFCRMIKLYDTHYGEDGFLEDLDWDIDEDANWQKIRQAIDATTSLAPKKPQSSTQGCPSIEKDFTDKGWVKINETDFNSLKNNDKVEVKYRYCEPAKKNLYFKRYKTKNSGGGNTATQTVETNIKDNSDALWETLFDKLTSANLNPKTGGVDIPDAETFTIGNYTISRTTKPFITYKIDDNNTITGNISGSKPNTTPYKYSGDDLQSLKLVLQNDPKGREFVSLAEFLGVGSKVKTPVVKNQRSSSSRVTSTYKPCVGTYGKGCKAEAIKKVQGCLGLTPDGKMGPRTVSAVNSKIGKSTFTDTDVANICGGSNVSRQTQQPTEFDGNLRTSTTEPNQTEQPSYSGDGY
jgi:hypothetical protein